MLFAACCFAQKPYKVVFYNLENFFDTINDPEVNDDEFTPEGPKKWNSVKSVSYTHLTLPTTPYV